MGMKRTLEVINALEAEGVIGRYAIAGAVAAYNYIEPTVTEGFDILLTPRSKRTFSVTSSSAMDYRSLGASSVFECK